MGDSARDALVAYLWSWLENQVMAALKAVPLGQTDGQRLLLRSGSLLASIADEAAAAEETLTLPPDWRSHPAATRRNTRACSVPERAPATDIFMPTPAPTLAFEVTY